MNYYYKDSISDFLVKSPTRILESLALQGGNDPGQVKTWTEEIELLLQILEPYRAETSEVKDDTRRPEIYDSTFEYLRSLGLEVI